MNKIVRPRWGLGNPPLPPPQINLLLEKKISSSVLYIASSTVCFIFL